jgi:hypothetical protein
LVPKRRCIEIARASREEWSKRVERWQDSGLSAKEFAAELDVSAKSLMFWKWKLRQDKPAPIAQDVEGRKRDKTLGRTSPASFQQLVPASVASPTGTALELVFRDGMAVRVAPGFDEPTLMRLLALLGGR